MLVTKKSKCGITMRT